MTEGNVMIKCIILHIMMAAKLELNFNVSFNISSNVHSHFLLFTIIPWSRYFESLRIHKKRGM